MANHDQGCECVICAGGSYEELYKNIRDHISREGHAVIGIEDSDPSFAYTIGEYEINAPELLIFGLSGPNSTMILNHIVAVRRRRPEGQTFRHGERVNLGGKYPPIIMDATIRAATDYAIQACEYYKIPPELLRVQLVVAPDTNGRYPWESGCKAPYANIPTIWRPTLISPRSGGPRCND